MLIYTFNILPTIPRNFDVENVIFNTETRIFDSFLFTGIKNKPGKIYPNEINMSNDSQEKDVTTSG